MSDKKQENSRRMEQIGNSPKPIFIYEEVSGPFQVDEELSTQIELFDLKNFDGGIFRGVHISKLKTVLKTGIDVAPPDSIIFVSEVSKAMEYGRDQNDPIVILSLDASKLLPTWKEVDSDIDPKELKQSKIDYPSQLISEDGNKIWLRKFQN